MRNQLIVFSLALLLIQSIPLAAQAGECFAGEVQVLQGTATIASGVNLRDNACMEQSLNLLTIPSASSVNVLGEWDGWYKVEFNGKRGWVYGTFVTKTNTTPGSSKNYQAFEEQYPSGNTGTTTPAPTPAPVSTNNRLNGYILLQVQSHGEAWYLHPTLNKRYYMKDGPTAYEMMRSFGLGITETDYEKMAAGNATLKAKLAGRIVLRVQAHGEAYYIHPKTLVMHYLKNGEEAYRIMREVSLGITDLDLSKIPSADLSPIPTTIAPTTLKIVTPTSTTVTSPQPVSTNITKSSKQSGWVPSALNMVELNKYWLSKVNALRAKKGLRLLSLDQRFVDTATLWSAEMSKRDDLTHDRTDGKTMNQWIDGQGLAFTERDSTNGWKENYFSENIAREYIANNMTDAKQALDRVMDAFLAEEAENGPHYRTVYHPDWNSVGVGFAFQQLSYSNAKTYITFHYGSLVR